MKHPKRPILPNKPYNSYPRKPDETIKTTKPLKTLPIGSYCSFSKDDLPDGEDIIFEIETEYGYYDEVSYKIVACTEVEIPNPYYKGQLEAHNKALEKFAVDNKKYKLKLKQYKKDQKNYDLEMKKYYDWKVSQTKDKK